MNDQWVQVNARLLPAERRKLKAYLDAEGLSYNAWLRQQIAKLPQYRVRYERVDDGDGGPAADESARSEKSARPIAGTGVTRSKNAEASDGSGADFLDRALQWLAANSEALQQFENQWIAIGPEGVIAADESYQTVAATAETLGVPEPLMHWVPAADRPPTAGQAERFRVGPARSAIKGFLVEAAELRSRIASRRADVPVTSAVETLRELRSEAT
jgi:hypothetical protein